MVDSTDLKQIRQEEEERNYQSALKKISGILDPDSSLPFIKHSEDPLEEVFQLLGKEMNISFTTPENIENISFKDRVMQTCDLSGVRYREVVLKKKWWKYPSGFLIGLTKENKPMLMVSGYNRYFLYSAEKKKKIDKHLASTVIEKAFYIYPYFPDKIKNLKELFLLFLSQSKRYFFRIFFYGFISGIISLSLPIFTKLFFAFALPQASYSFVFHLFSGMGLTILGFIIFYVFRGLSILKMEGITTQTIQASIWDRVLKLSPPFFRKFSIGNLFWRISSIEETRMNLSGNSLSILVNAIFALFYLPIMFFYAYQLTLLVIASNVMGLAFLAFCWYKASKPLKEFYALQGNIRGAVIQMVGGVAKLRVSCAEKSAFSYWMSYFAKTKALQLQAKKMEAIVFSLSGFLPLFTTTLVYFYLLFILSVQMISLPDFLAFNIAFGAFNAAFLSFYANTTRWVNTILLLQRVKPILEEQPESKDEETISHKISGNIYFDEVVFGYNSEDIVLNNISILIPSKAFIGIVGPSGCGKSTLARLLLGFEKPFSGAVYYDNKDLATLNKQYVRKQIGTVFQENGIIAGTILDNLTFSRIFTKEEIEKALQLSGFEEDLQTMPMGIYTFLPMNGETLSGGQKQRLLLCRALLGSPSILLLDEATSSLDNNAQEQVMKNIASLEVTRIVIAQRLHTLKEADCIYVLDKGKIEQKGSYKELAEKEGLFQEMVKRQEL